MQVQPSKSSNRMTRLILSAKANLSGLLLLQGKAGLISAIALVHLALRLPPQFTRISDWQANIVERIHQYQQFRNCHHYQRHWYQSWYFPGKPKGWDCNQGESLSCEWRDSVLPQERKWALVALQYQSHLWWIVWQGRKTHYILKAWSSLAGA
jgi:hypothetical protein